MSLEKLYEQYGKVCLDLQVLQQQKVRLEQEIVKERRDSMVAAPKKKLDKK